MKRIEPLMLNNKLAIVRINQLIDRVDGDISSPDGTVELEVGDGTVFSDGDTVILHTAVGNAGKRILIKSTGETVTVRPKNNEGIDGYSGETRVPHLHCMEIMSDGMNWWVI